MAVQFAIVSLGCAKNLVDSEVMADRLLAAGYEKTEPEQAALLIINTCAFIDPAGASQCRSYAFRIFR